MIRLVLQRKKEIHLSRPEITRLSYCFCGYHDCPSGYAYGPTVRDEHILHFVTRGAGYYKINRSTFRVSSGSSFMLFPGHILHYQADRTDPWEYYWVGFEGRDAQAVLDTCGLAPSSPVVTHKDPDKMRRLFQRLQASAAKQSIRADMEAMSLFYCILTMVVGDIAAARGMPDGREGVEEENEHVRKAVAYIQENYFDCNLSVDGIAGSVFLERSYFSTLFRDHMGMPPHNFLIKIRMENACRMLSESSVSVKKVSCSVGYPEQSYFVKVFEKYVGTSPTEYRRSVRKVLTGAEKDADVPEELDRSFFS
jgi:AraC-like DNA-binding protein